MSEHYLRFKDLNEAIAACMGADFMRTDTAQPTVKRSPGWDIVLGVNCSYETGVTLTDNEGFIYPETLLREGFHVNVQMNVGDLPEILKPFEVFPVTPSCVWS